MSLHQDEAFMRATLALARRGLGRTAPNPSVAAMVIDYSHSVPHVLGRGLTAPGGRPHAEALALIEAGTAARGATLYVTLEPCNRRSQRDFGLSCADRILESGIARVVIGAADPSPFAAGEGAARLRAAGVEVVEAVLAHEAGRITEGHSLRVRENRPFVTLKLAQTADGFAGTTDRKPLAITGEEARAYVHRQRASHDALITGIGTVLADDPRLDVRLPGMESTSPMLVVMDSQGRLPRAAKLLASLPARPVLVATQQPEAFTEQEGLEAIAMPSGADGLDLAALLAALAARGMTRVMVEAGPGLADSFAKAGLIDELVLLSGKALNAPGLPALLENMTSWKNRASLIDEAHLGPDLLQIYRGGA